MRKKDKKGGKSYKNKKKQQKTICTKKLLLKQSVWDRYLKQDYASTLTHYKPRQTHKLSRAHLIVFMSMRISVLYPMTFFRCGYLFCEEKENNVVIAEDERLHLND